MSKNIKFLYTFAVVMVIAVVALGGGVAKAATPAQYGLQEGWTISAAGSDDPDIYIVNEPGYKRLFLNPVIFNFYGHLGGFPAVHNVSAATRDAFPTSGIFRNCETNDPKVYGVEVTGEDTGMLHWVNVTGAQAVAQDANFFQKVFCINNNEFNWYAKGADYSSVNQIPSYSRTPGTPTGPLSASLASDNPAAGTLLEEQSFATLLKFNVAGSGAVTKVVLDRLGISGDATLSNVYLFVNGKRVSDGNTFSSNVLTFVDANGLFNAPATVEVRANVANGESGKTIGVKLTMLNDSAVSLMGNTFNIATESNDLSDISIGSAAGGGSLDPQADITVWQGDLSSGVNDVWFKRLQLRMVGSASAADFANFRLYLDGIQIATANGIDSNDYVTFLGNTKIMTNQAGVLKVVADIVGGAGKTYQFQLRGSTASGTYDLELVDADFNVGIPLVTGTFPFGPSSGTIGSASLTIVKAVDSPSSDVVLTTDDVTFATYKFTAYGEAVKIDTLTVQASMSEGSANNLRDGRILINGQQYGSTQVLTDDTDATFTVNYTLQPGQTATVEVRADAKENSGTALAANEVISAVLILGVDNAEGVSSGTVIDAPSSSLEGNNRIIVTGTVALAKDLSYADQTLVVPTGSIKIGDYVLTGSSTEGGTVTGATVTVDSVSGTTGANEMRDIFVKYGTSGQTTIRSTVAATQDFTFTYSLGINEILPIEVWAQVLSTASTSGQTFKTTLDVTGSTTPSGTAFVISPTNGQTHTIGAGSFTSERDTSLDATYPARLVGDESTVIAAAFKFSAQNDTYKISRLNLEMSGTSGVNAVRVKDGSTVLATLPAAADMTFYIPSAQQPSIAGGTSKTLTVELELGTIASAGGGASGANHTITLDSSESRVIPQATGAETAMTSADATGNVMYAYKAVPVITRQALPSVVLTAGGTTMTIAKFNVSSSTGDVEWVKFTLGFVKSANITALSSIAVYDSSDTAISGTLSSTSSQITFLATNPQAAGDYTVKAKINGTTGGTDYVTVNFEHSALGFVAPTASASVGATSTLVWSDKAEIGEGETSIDWNNDYLIKNLPLDSWSLQD